jgi:uncharacterized membrane protein YcgQ (UPF0703/DUF1980 family)
MKNSIIAFTLFMFAGCASMQVAPTGEITALPIVRVGEKPPQTTEYVVLYPAGFSFPVTLTTGGSLFSSPQQFASEVSLTRDLYLYKYWASHDGKTWKNSHELLEVSFGGGFDVTGLQANIKLEATE